MELANFAPPSLSMGGGGTAAAAGAAGAGGGGGGGGSSSSRARLVWSPELHTRFIQAVHVLGVNSAVPKTILALMQVGVSVGRVGGREYGEGGRGAKSLADYFPLPLIEAPPLRPNANACRWTA